MCKEVNVKESEWSECKSFLHSWQVKIQTWMLDSPAHVTSRSSIISSLAVCLREMPFSIFTRNIAVFTFHSTWPHQAEVGSGQASPSKSKVCRRVRWAGSYWKMEKGEVEIICLLTWISLKWPRFLSNKLAWIRGSTWNENSSRSSFFVALLDMVDYYW